MLGGVEVDIGRWVVVECRVEQSQLELLPQDPQYGAVDQRLVDLSGLNQFLERRRVGVAGGQFHVDPGCQRLGGRLAEVVGHPVQQVQEGDAEVVRHDCAVESPLIAENAGQQTLGRRRPGCHRFRYRNA